MTKVTIIGAGSMVFATQLMTDILAIPALDKGTFALVDIDTERLALAHQMAELLIELTGRDWDVVVSSNRREVLADSDFVISTIDVAGLENVRHDYDIPLKFGVDQCIGDTIGPGGLFKALRTIPAWLDILQDIEKLAPGALVLNYTNPMSLTVLAGIRSSRLPIVGLCHSVQHTSQKLASYLDIPYPELIWEVGGINHLAWFTKLEHNGKDLYPLLRERAKISEVYEDDPIRFELMLELGAFVTESSGHASEYLPYFRKRPTLIEKYTRDGYLGQSGFYADNWPSWRAVGDYEIKKHLKRQARGRKSRVPLERSDEYASAIIEAIISGKPAIIYGNVLNEDLIHNLPGDGVVEVACRVDVNGLQPIPFHTLPTHLAALAQPHIAFHSLVVEAVLKKNREAAVHALMLDPLTAAVCSLAEIRQMFNEMATAQKIYLPEFITEI